MGICYYSDKSDRHSNIHISEESPIEPNPIIEDNDSVSNAQKQNVKEQEKSAENIHSNAEDKNPLTLNSPKHSQFHKKVTALKHPQTSYLLSLTYLCTSHST